MSLYFEERDERGGLYIVPKAGGYYVSPQGVLLEDKVTGRFEELFGRGCDGYRQ